MVLLVFNIVLFLDLLELVAKQILLSFGSNFFLVSGIQVGLELGRLFAKRLNLVADILKLGP